MARKKRVRRTRRVSRKVSHSRSFNFGGGNVKKKISLVINNLLLFVALSLVSFVLYNFLQNEILTNLFLVMAMIFGFVAVGFLITLLILFIIKMIKKR